MERMLNPLRKVRRSLKSQEVQINTYNAELTLDTHSASIGTHSGDEGKNSLWNEQEYIGTQSCIIHYCG